MERSERTPQKGECDNAWRLPSIGKRCESIKTATQKLIDKPFAYKGRKPNHQISPKETLELFTDFIASKGTIREAINSIESERSEKKCVYTNTELLWTTLLLFMLRFSSKNQFDQNRNSREFSETILNLARRPYDKNNKELHTACTQTLVNFMKKINPESINNKQVEIVRYLLRGKWFERAKIRGYYCVAVDATLKDQIYLREGEEEKSSRRNRYVLDAKLITPWGWAISIISEPIEPYNSESEKQDSEIKGFKRLAPKLKEALKGYGICIIGDALYQCRPIMDLCESYKWKYIFTAKEGRGKALYEAFQEEMRMNPHQSAKIFNNGGKDITELQWAEGDTASYNAPYQLNCNFIEVHEDKKKTHLLRQEYNGAFVTNFVIKNEINAKEIVQWGRLRWNIENSFKVMKHDGYGLEHTFSLDEKISNNLYAMMTIAHTIWQIFYAVVEGRFAKKVRKMTQKEIVEKLKQGFINIGILERVLDKKLRFSRAYTDRWRINVV